MCGLQSSMEIAAYKAVSAGAESRCVVVGYCLMLGPKATFTRNGDWLHCDSSEAGCAVVSIPKCAKEVRPTGKTCVRLISGPQAKLVSLLYCTL